MGTFTASETTYDFIAETFVPVTRQASQNVNAAVEALRNNPDDPALLVESQLTFFQLQTSYQVPSNILSALRSLIQGITQQIN